MKRESLIVLTVALLPLSCSKGRSFPPIGHVTRLEVRTSNNRPIKTIRSKEQIARVVLFVDRHRSGWGTPWAGVPVPELVVDFYDGKEFKGHLGVGQGYLETQREGDFMSKSVSTAEQQEFLELIGVSNLP